MSREESREIYESPFTKRYATDNMRYIFSEEFKFETWRELWVILAEAEKKLGLPISDEQIEELKDNMHNVNYEVAEEIEKETHHDVMAHIRAYGKQCPNAAGIIHLGATSCYITDNADTTIMKSALMTIQYWLMTIVSNLEELADIYRGMPTLGYTHYQPAQPTTVGKRICMWLQDFKSDLDDVRYMINNMKTLGCKGATGTQASFLELFDGDYDKVEKLDKLVCDDIGIDSYEITGQTYPRKLDMKIYNILAGIAVSASKMANDIRLLQHDGEMKESFGLLQVGSSAMAYKQNPIKCEKIVGLSRRVITDSINPALTASVQWLERTLDDSANRRLVMSEGFLTVDEILITCINVIEGLCIYGGVIEKNLEHKLPYIMTENIMMRLVEDLGMDRQEVHEEIRRMSMNVDQGLSKDLLLDISDRFEIPYEELKAIADPSKYIGCAKMQVERYIGRR